MNGVPDGLGGTTHGLGRGGGDVGSGRHCAGEVGGEGDAGRGELVRRPLETDDGAGHGHLRTRLAKVDMRRREERTPASPSARFSTWASEGENSCDGFDAVDWDARVDAGWACD